MATSRPIRKSEWLTYLSGHHIGGNRAADGDERPLDFILQSDFGLDILNGNEYRSQVCTRVFGLQPSATNASLTAAITNGTAPGLYVREGDDTSNWEVYREVLARRVEEAMAARRGGVVGAEVGETMNGPRREAAVAVGVFPDGREAVVDPITVHVVSSMATRRDHEIRVGDVVEVVSCRGGNTVPDDIGCGGCVDIIHGTEYVRLLRFEGMRLPDENIASLADVRKVSSPSDEVRRMGIIAPPTEARASINFVDVSTISAAEAYRRLAVDDRRLSNVPSPSSRSAPQPSSPQPSSPQPPPPLPSRFSLLEVDADPSTDAAQPPPPQAPKPSTGLAALQQELRAEREAKRALAAAQTPPGRFDLLECDLPAVPATVAAKPAKAPLPQRPVVSSPPAEPHSRNPVETITDLTAARSPLELARMLESIGDELSTMMRQRESN